MTETKRKWNNENVIISALPPAETLDGKVYVQIIKSQSDPNVKIYNSYKITDKTERRQILDVIMKSELFKSSGCTRSESSYMTEWYFHNLAYRTVGKIIPPTAKRFGDCDLNEKQFLFNWEWDL